ncbi:MAG: hypothetical protein MZV64_64415 [Ignavibacteriales bacterium]|nr:hypothetical protein [Ignavibacteriales bacterium]
MYSYLVEHTEEHGDNECSCITWMYTFCLKGEHGGGYYGKPSTKTILSQKGRGKLVLNKNIGGYSDNKLIIGDNFKSMKCLLYDFDLAGKTDLVYIDPTVRNSK